MFQIGLKKFLLLKTLKIPPSTYVISNLKGEQIVGTFYEKELQKTNQKELSVEKVIKGRGDELYFKWQGYGSSFKRWIDKKYIIKMSEYFPEQNSSGRRQKVELNLSNYTTKANFEKCNGY